MIINPMFFYLMQASENVGIAMKVFGPIMSLLGILAFLIYNDPYTDENKRESLSRLSKLMIPAGIIILFVGILVPDKDTLLLMQAARLATTENVNSVFEALKAAMDYAVTILE